MYRNNQESDGALEIFITSLGFFLIHCNVSQIEYPKKRQRQLRRWGKIRNINYKKEQKEIK